MGEMVEFAEKLHYDVGKELFEKKLTLALAESCSGGLIAHRITQVPGASRFFVGGIVAYSNDLKIQILGVNPDVINKYGAVSKETALEMAHGMCHISGAEISCSVTGITGPEGGTKEKPVGTVYIAIVSHRRAICERCQFTGSREEIKNKTANRALELIIQFISKYYA